MNYAQKRKQNNPPCTSSWCSETGETLRIFHGVLDWYCCDCAKKIDTMHGKR